jgi:hypothetical protein
MVSSKPVITSGGVCFPFKPFICFLEEDGTLQDFAYSMSHIPSKRKLKQEADVQESGTSSCLQIGILGGRKMDFYITLN